MQEIPSKKMVGERIRGLRIENKFSQSFIAGILGLSRSNYSQIELGNQYPTFNTLHTLAVYYNKSYEWLLHGTNAICSPKSEKSPADLEPILKQIEDNFKQFKSSLKVLEREISSIRNSLQV